MTATCDHCGLPAPAPVLERDGDDARTYCCAGCAIVARTLRGHGLTSYYDVRARDDAPAAPARATGASYAELDDPAHQRAHVRAGADGAAETSLYLEDLRCTACVWLVEATPQCLPGVRDVRVDLGRGKVDVVFDPAATSLAAIARHLDRLGHPPHVYRAAERDRRRRLEDRAHLIKIGIAGAAVGNLMLLAAALYAGVFDAMAAGDVTFFRWASMLVALPSLTFAALPFFRTALASLRTRRLHLDLPLSLAIVVGLGWGSANVVRGVGEIYFDSIAMLIFLLLIARFIVGRHARRASSAAELMLALTPSRARRVAPTVDVAARAPLAEELAEVPAEALAAGDRVQVRPGERIPVDGVVRRGRSSLDAGLLSGESRPIEVDVGGEVHAGTVNLVGDLVVEAAAVGEATRVGKLVARIDELGRRRAPIEQFVDRIAGRFVLVVMLAALATFALWALGPAHAPGAGLEHAMALLVVTCPCVLMLATPMAVAIALGRGARRGVLVKGLHSLEALARPGTIVLDKTGTITEGRLAIASIAGDPAVLRLAAALEQHSAHPIARALVAQAGVGELPRAEDVREELGRGVRGTIAGHAVAVGSPPWLRLGGYALAPSLEAELGEIAGRGETPLAIAVDGAVVAVLGLADPLRATAEADVRALRAAGWQVELLSGDDPQVVATVGARLGLPISACRGGVSPEGKLARVRTLRAADPDAPVVMVGDGVNDAAAMAAATCGVAVAGAAEVALDAADVLLRVPGTAGLLAVIDAGRHTLAAIRRSLYITLAYNVIAGVLAVTGLIHPLIAALMMPLSASSVLVSTLRSRAFTGGPVGDPPTPAPTRGPTPTSTPLSATMPLAEVSR